MKIYLSIICALLVLTSWGQEQKGRRQGNGPGQDAVKGEIFGQVKDKSTNENLEYAAVSLYHEKGEKLVSGAMTNEKGKFTIEDIPAGKYYLLIQFVGFEEKRISDITISKDNLALNLREIYVTSDNTLDEIVLDGSTPTVRYEIDKKVVEVGNLEVDLGQSAVEILENTPSITVDIDGTVSLRGSSSFTLLINGRPTPMDPSDALASIPASTIKNIEIITNPSAKYEAEGVAGIMNIITKSNKLEGVSLLTNISGGSYDNYSGDVAVNIREDQFEINVGGDFRNRTRPSFRSEERITTFDTYQSIIKSDGESDWQTKRYGVNGEIAWTPNSAHRLSIGGRYNRRQMNSINQLFFQEYNIGGTDSLYQYYNDGNALYDITSSSTYLNYRFNVHRDKDHYLDFRAVYNTRAGDDVVYADFLDLDYVKTGGTRNTEKGPSGMFRFNLDYSKKLESGIVIEAGTQLQVGESRDENRNYQYNPITEEYELDERFSSEAHYIRNIAGFYGLFKGESGKLGYQLGLRGEYTDRTIESGNEYGKTEINRMDWFPTVHLSYQLPKDNQLLLNYTRRIQRPRSWYLEPFITWQNQYSLYSGNPNLQPEYVNAFEVNWLKTLGRKGSISVESYLRYVENYIDRIQVPYSTDTANLIMTTPVNVGETYSLGAEPNFSYKIAKWWKMDLAFNLFYYVIESKHEQIRSSENFNWNSRFTNTFPIGHQWSLQITSRYVAPNNTSQGRSEGFFTANGSIRKSFSNNKYGLNLQVRDIFSTMQRVNYTEAGNVVINSLREPRTPTVLLTFSMRLNNYNKRQGQEEETDDF